ncbi:MULTISPECIES: MptD family putative ECF transporter S component [Butyrivibrio]|uniref:Energy-coupling factor transport system substrate-specific component n=1 Tax=Butyrivibrio hungatei TaxID=185008 RepID=A0A1G5F5W3_9FIRM|nr:MULTISPECIES: MptD family putative ECF transporter S component [Butyrivibrio]SCY34491.1 energy-coupling factor transport system substrate-specific component [Butyrivibrio hungatei]
MEKKFEIKDLITVGVFSALYFVVMFAVACFGFIPIFMVFTPFLCPLVAGIPLMLYFSKIKHFGMITITGTLIGIIMFVIGHPYPILLFCIGAGLLTEVILKMGNYQSIKHCVAGSAVFSLWFLGMVIAFFFSFREAYFASIVDGYGQEYVEAMKSYTPTWVFFAMIIMCLVGGAIGGLLGAKVLKKHFRKAGMA